MTTASAPPPGRGAAGEREPRRLWHPPWCDKRCCPDDGGHISEQFTLDGAVPLVVEVYGRSEEPGPLLSILERQEGGDGVTLSVSQGTALAAVLAHIHTHIEAGAPLDPPGTGREEVGVRQES